MVLTGSGWTRFAQRCARWLVWAMLLTTLAPAVSRTLAATRAEGPSSWVDLCTTEGLQRVALAGLSGDRVAEQGQAPDHRLLDHCGLCLLAAERFAPLIPTWASLPFEPNAQVASEQSARSSALRPEPQPSARGPPFLI